jgi:hypothetical protein
MPWLSLSKYFVASVNGGSSNRVSKRVTQLLGIRTTGLEQLAIVSDSGKWIVETGDVCTAEVGMIDFDWTCPVHLGRKLGCGRTEISQHITTVTG